MVKSELPWRVLASRPVQQNKAWVARLKGVGFATLEVPLLEIVAATTPEQLQAIKQIILDFDQYDGVIFVSQNAVQHTWAWLDQYWPQLPTAMNYFAVGQKTACEITKLLLPESTGGVTAAVEAMNSEELLSLDALQQVENKKILICRGIGGRTTLAEQLQARGARVSYCELYERALPKSAISELAANKFSDERDLLSVFSGETLENLVQAMRLAELSLQHLPLLIPGERVAAAARVAGFQQLIIARNASEPEMLAALTQFIQTSG